MAEAVRELPPRQVPTRRRTLRLSGLEPFEKRPDSNFINIGERTNVTGSARFARLIREEAYDEAVDVVGGTVDAEGGTAGGRLTQPLVQRLRAVVSGTDGDGLAVEQRGHVDLTRLERDRIAVAEAVLDRSRFAGRLCHDRLELTPVTEDLLHAVLLPGLAPQPGRLVVLAPVFEDAGQAHRRLEDRLNVGKVILVPRKASE